MKEKIGIQSIGAPGGDLHMKRPFSPHELFWKEITAFFEMAILAYPALLAASSFKPQQNETLEIDG